LLQTTVVRKKFLSALKKGPKNLAKVIKQTEEEKSHKKGNKGF